MNRLHLLIGSLSLFALSFATAHSKLRQSTFDFFSFEAFAKKEEAFASDAKPADPLQALRGSYTLSSVSLKHPLEDAGESARAVSSKVALHFDEKGVEIVSNRGPLFTSCDRRQTVSLLPGNLLKIAAAGDCPELQIRLAAIEGAGERLLIESSAPFLCNNRYLCSGLYFTQLSDDLLGEKMMAWTKEGALPPTIKSLQWPEADAAEVAAIRNDFREKLARTRFVLSKSVKSITGTVLFGGGSATSTDKPVSQLLAYGVRCSLSGGPQGTILPFTRRIAQIQVSHPLQQGGLWIVDQIHEGASDPIEKRRVPTESEDEVSGPLNQVTIVFESDDSGLEGRPLASERKLSFTCRKAMKNGLITFNEMRSALGDVVQFKR